MIYYFVCARLPGDFFFIFCILCFFFHFLLLMKHNFFFFLGMLLSFFLSLSTILWFLPQKNIPDGREIFLKINFELFMIFIFVEKCHPKSQKRPCLHTFKSDFFFFKSLLIYILKCEVCDLQTYFISTLWSV